MPQFTIAEVTDATDEICEAFERLIPQLTRSSPPPIRDDLSAVIASPCAVVFVARDPDRQNRIMGSLTMVLYRTPMGLHTRIEAVVVDREARRKGIGAALMRAAIQRAFAAGARRLNLVTGRGNEAANGLYRSVGFELRDAKQYSYDMER